MRENLMSGIDEGVLDKPRGEACILLYLIIVTNWDKAIRNRYAMNSLLIEFAKTECEAREDSLSKPC
jgi:hypothetical protein